MILVSTNILLDIFAEIRVILVSDAENQIKRRTILRQREMADYCKRMLEYPFSHVFNIHGFNLLATDISKLKKI